MSKELNVSEMSLEALKRPRVAVIFGTRPEAIKLFPVIRELESKNQNPLVISTGQQRDLLAMTLKSLQISPNIELHLMREDPTTTSFLEDCISELTSIFQTAKPDFIIVQGDTFSAAAGALAGYLNHIPVGHVEAGLRSNDLDSPWPEEGLRRVIDGISKILWAPTQRDVIPVHADQRIKVVGNTVTDALRLIIGTKQQIWNSKSQIVVTLHRRESFGATMEAALKAVVELSHQIENEIIFLQHPNPNVEKAVKFSNLKQSRVKIIEPLPYVEFMELISRASLLITDSGGLQEESTILNLPTIILRDTTERADALQEDRGILSNPDGSNLMRDVKSLLNSSISKSKSDNKPFGDGHSAEVIVDDIQQFLGGVF